MRVDTSNLLAPPAEEKPTPVWGEGERPSWLLTEEQQPKKREWSPVRDRMEAELELRARLEEQRKLRAGQRWRWVKTPLLWTWSLATAVISVSREEPGVELAEETPIEPQATVLDLAPPSRPVEDLAPSSEPAVIDTEAAAPSETPPRELPEVDWTVPPPAPVEPAEPRRAPVAPAKDWRPQAGATPAWEVIPRAEPAGEAPAADAAPAEEAPAAPETVVAPEHAWPTAEESWAATEATGEEESAPEEPAREARAAETPVEPAPPSAPAVALPAAPARVDAGELGRVLLATGMRTSGAEVGIVTLLQDDVLVMRASAGIDAHVAGRLALDLLSDVCLDVIASGQTFTAASNWTTPDPDRPSAILCVPILLNGTAVGAVLMLAYAPGARFTPDHERLLRALAEVAGPELSSAGAFRLDYSQPGVLWRRLEVPLTPAPVPPAGEQQAAAAEDEAAAPEPEPPPPALPMTHTTLQLDREQVRRLIAQARAAQDAQEKAAAQVEAAEADVEPEPEPGPAPEPEPELATPATEELRREPLVEEPAVAAEAPESPPAAEEPAAALPETEPTPAPRPATPARTTQHRHRVGWRARVQSRMTSVRQQRAEEQARYRGEILAAIRNLSWDGYQALIADIFRRKAFEVLPPPSEGTDLDVIDLVVNRDDLKWLVNCQLRGEMDVPIEAVTEMAAVARNYDVSGAYLIADGSFAPEAHEFAPTGGIVLIDGNSLIDLTIETTLKDERKQSLTSRLAKRIIRR